MNIKKGVYGITHVYLHKATAEWVRVLDELGIEDEPAITSCQDGRHSPKSDHWDGRALDYRTYIIPQSQRKKAADMLRKRLQPASDWFILLESDHLHVSYRGKTAVN